MATGNYVLLERITVGAAGASSVTFSNIPQTGYTDLKIVLSARTNAARTDDYALINFNGVSTNLTCKILYGAGSSNGSVSASNINCIIGAASATANTFGNTEFYIPNYTSSNYKSVCADGVQENNATSSVQNLTTGLWSSTSAITSVTFSATYGSFVQYSTFSLYALAAVGVTPTKDPKALGGDIIQTDGTYWYHACIGSGSFTPKTNLSCDVLVVAGGGGADNAGGGAGGVLAFSSQPFNSGTSYTATVGAGGASAGSRSNGTNSSFGSLTPVSVGGGYGGSTTGNSGGSGGGSYSASGSTAGAAGTSGQGNNGGASGGGGGGGGGGAGAVGATATTSVQGGAGGAGVNTVTNWGTLSGAFAVLPLGVSGYIAGGGGGYGSVTNSTGGSGGGGTGSAGGGALAASAGAPNTGSGGGNGASGTGGSGVIIVRYLV